jgi:hypothetical protein
MLLLASRWGAGQVPEPDEIEQDETEPRTVLERVARAVFTGIEARGGWDEHGTYFVSAAERLFAQQGWDSEPDLFTLDVMREAGQIPPWEIRTRFDVLTGRFADRYLLDEEQTAYFRATMEREVYGLFGRHAAEIVPALAEFAQRRLAGEPVTAEQVERWTRAVEPAFYDVRARVNAVSEALMERMSPVQREWCEVDLAAMNRRLDTIEAMGEHWWDGDWMPSDWGLDADPIQTGRWARATTQPTIEDAAALVADRGTVKEATSQPAEDAWAAYVRAFIARYGLNADQTSSAWRLYDRVRQRRAHHLRRVEQERAGYARAVARGDRRARERLAAVGVRWKATEGMLFETLKRGLERLPTRRQRLQAEPGPLQQEGEAPNIRGPGGNTG